METRFEPSTIRCDVALKDVFGTVAVIVATPACWPVVLPEIPTLATVLSDEDQLT
jgi:hypothetical protein